MSFKIAVVICLASVVLVNAQLPDVTKCFDTMRTNILEYSSKVRELSTKFIEDLSKDSGFDVSKYMDQLNELNAQYMEFASSLGSMNPQALMDQINEILQKQTNLFQGLLMSVRPNPGGAMRGLQFIQDLTSLNMNYATLLNPLSCLQGAAVTASQQSIGVTQA